MNVAQASIHIERALAVPLSPWPGFSPETIPLVLFDDNGFCFYHHPYPPHDRPADLLGASFSCIAGALTATIPVAYCLDESDLLPLVYHESFHVYQHNGAFCFDESFDFFRSLAFYPELDPTYRALCLAEVETLEHSTLTYEEKAARLAWLAGERQQILAKRQGSVEFVQHLERLEGTAYYVEQGVRAQCFGTIPEMFSTHYDGITPSKYGWTRHHAVGAALCRVLDQVLEEWQAQVAAGASLSELLISHFGQNCVDPDELCLADKIESEGGNAARIQARLEADLERWAGTGVIHIQWPTGVPYTRALRPTEAVSLGDGRLIHGDFLVLHVPNGTIDLRGGCILEDYNRCQLTFPAVPLQQNEDQLRADADTAQIALSGVRKIGENTFRLEPI